MNSVMPSEPPLGVSFFLSAQHPGGLHGSQLSDFYLLSYQSTEQEPCLKTYFSALYLVQALRAYVSLL